MSGDVRNRWRELNKLSKTCLPNFEEKTTDDFREKETEESSGPQFAETVERKIGIRRIPPQKTNFKC